MEGRKKVGEVKNGGVGRAKSWGWGLGVHSVSRMDLEQVVKVRARSGSPPQRFVDRLLV